MTTATQIERLEQAARVIRELPAEMTLNMMVWRFNECNTVACLAGWCAVDSWFMAQGFHAGRIGEPKYQGKTGFEAIGLFFSNRARCLFFGDRPSDRKAVIASLERFIATHTPKREPTELPVLLIFQPQDSHRAAP